MITMTRRLTFSAAHADWLPALSQVENEIIFGAAAAQEPYGHNYVLDVSVVGDINPTTGILVNIKEIDRIVKQNVVQVLDRKFINRQVARFETQPITLENLVCFVVEEIQEQLPSEVTLSAIRLAATPEYFVAWHNVEHDDASQTQSLRSGKETGKMLLTRAYEFAASHRLHSPHLSEAENRELFGKCNFENGHGHNYEVEITVTGPVEARSGRVMAPETLDDIANREVIDRYDHRHFNYDVPEFSGLIPSAEVITRMIWDRLETHIPAPARLYRVLVRETPRNIFEYYGDSHRKEDDVL